MEKLTIKVRKNTRVYSLENHDMEKSERTLVYTHQKIMMWKNPRLKSERILVYTHQKIMIWKNPRIKSEKTLVYSHQKIMIWKNSRLKSERTLCVYRYLYFISQENTMCVPIGVFRETKKHKQSCTENDATKRHKVQLNLTSRTIHILCISSCN